MIQTYESQRSSTPPYPKTRRTWIRSVLAAGWICAASWAVGCGGTGGSPATVPETQTGESSPGSAGSVPLLAGQALELRALLLLMADQKFLDPVTVAGAAGGDPELRRQLALTLGRVGDPRGGPTLQSLMIDDDPKVRRAAIFALGELGERGYSGAVQPLLGAAAGADHEAGWLAVEGLAKSAVPLDQVVQRLLDAPSGQILPRLVPSLFRFRTPAVVRWAEQGLHEPRLRAMAAYGLTREPQPEGLEAIRGLVSDDDPWVRGWAARALGRVGTADDLELLRPLLDDTAPGPTIYALRSARMLVDKGLVAAPDPWRPRLLELLEDPRVDVRTTAIEAATAWLLDEPLGQRLEQFVRRGSTREQELALMALAEAGDPRLLEVLAAAARSPESVVRAAATRAAGLSGQSDLLAAAIIDTGPAVRTAGYEVLLELTDKPAEPVGLALADDDYMVRASMLDWAAGRPLLPLETLAAAWQRAVEDREPDARIAAVRALLARAQADATEKGAIIALLEQIAEEAGYLARREAATALQTLGQEVPKVGKVESRRGIEVYRQIVARTAQPVRYALDTEEGTLILELACPEAPLTCLSFQQLADQGFYDGLRFHRIVPDFVAQGGDPRGDGAGGPGYALRDELNTLRFDAGALGMAHAGPDTAGSQFFIAITPQPHLDGGYTVFGRVVEGLPLLRRWQQGERIQNVRRLGDMNASGQTIPLRRDNGP